jgi:hypothetical protein
MRLRILKTSCVASACFDFAWQRSGPVVFVLHSLASYFSEVIRLGFASFFSYGKKSSLVQPCEDTPKRRALTKKPLVWDEASGTMFVWDQIPNSSPSWVKASSKGLNSAKFWFQMMVKTPSLSFGIGRQRFGRWTVFGFDAFLTRFWVVTVKFDGRRVSMEVE